MAIEVGAVDRLRRGIEYMLGTGDITSANIFSDEGKSTSTTGRRGRGLIGQFGEQFYLAQLIKQAGN